MSRSDESLTYLRPGEPGSRLDDVRFAQDRDAASHRPVDVLVIGGGITGCGVALDAASRGLSVALVERGDLASGTSSYSSKLVHSGLRYLASGEVGLAWQSTREKAILMQRTAGHLTRTLTQVVPVPANERAGVMGAGLLAADAMHVAGKAGSRPLPRARIVPIEDAAPLVPGLDAAGSTKAALLTDGQLVDDARLVVAVARTAAAFGALILTHTAAIEVGPGGAVVEDVLDGGRYEIQARHVVNATGVWAGTWDSAIRLRPSRGTHLVVPAARLGFPTGALTVAHPHQPHRYLFALPQADSAAEDLVYVGITDVALGPGEQDSPASLTSTADEVTEILDGINAALEIGLTNQDVIATYAGLRPLVDPGEAAGRGGRAEASLREASSGASSMTSGAETSRSETSGSRDSRTSATADLSRAHLVHQSDDGLITVTGGKLTTYRLMAQDVVDRITSVPCRTTDIALVGAAPGSDADKLAARWASSGADPQDVRWRMARRYGAESDLLLAAMEQSGELRAPLGPNSTARLAEVWFARAYEGARTVDDVCTRRIRLDVLGDAGVGLRETAASWLTRSTSTRAA